MNITCKSGYKCRKKAINFLILKNVMGEFLPMCKFHFYKYQKDIGASNLYENFIVFSKEKYMKYLALL